MYMISASVGGQLTKKYNAEKKNGYQHSVFRGSFLATVQVLLLVVQASIAGSIACEY